jgi:hypothetical protein
MLTDSEGIRMAIPLIMHCEPVICVNYTIILLASEFLQRVSFLPPRSPMPRAASPSASTFAATASLLKRYEPSPFFRGALNL